MTDSIEPMTPEREAQLRDYGSLTFKQAEEVFSELDRVRSERRADLLARVLVAFTNTIVFCLTFTLWWWISSKLTKQPPDNEQLYLRALTIVVLASLFYISDKLRKIETRLEEIAKEKDHV